MSDSENISPIRKNPFSTGTFKKGKHPAAGSLPGCIASYHRIYALLRSFLYPFIYGFL